MCLLFFSSLKLPLFWPLIDANISDQLLKLHKMACKAYRDDFSRKKKCRYGFQAAKKVQVCHTGPYRRPGFFVQKPTI